jgi:hypothetical protein
MPLPALDQLFSSEGDTDTKHDDADLTDELSSAVQRFGQMNVHVAGSPAGES